MKVCKFCGTENQDSATVWSSYKENEFNYKCGNFGTIFEKWIFSPKCSVKAGGKAKKYLRRWAKTRIIAVDWILCGIIVLAGCSGDSNATGNSEKDVSNSVVSEETVQSDNSITTSSSNNENEIEEPQKIVNDEVVNGFLSECKFDYGEIDNGNIRTKFFVHINGCRTELLNSNTNVLSITINGYHIDNINEEEVLEAFKMVAQTINGNDYDTELEEVINGLLEHNTDIYKGHIGSLYYIFHPFVEFSDGEVSQSRIDIGTDKYNVE